MPRSSALLRAIALSARITSTASSPHFFLPPHHPSFPPPLPLAQLPLAGYAVAAGTSMHSVLLRVICCLLGSAGRAGARFVLSTFLSYPPPAPPGPRLQPHLSDLPSPHPLPFLLPSLPITQSYLVTIMNATTFSAAPFLLLAKALQLTCLTVLSIADMLAFSTTSHSMRLLCADDVVWRPIYEDLARRCQLGGVDEE